MTVSAPAAPALRLETSTVPGDARPGAGSQPDPPAGRPPEALGYLIARGAAVTLAGLLGVLLLQIVALSPLEEGVAQQNLYAALRNQLAAGTAPVGPFTAGGRVLTAGTPVALLEIPRLHLRDVVTAGTDSRVLDSGPGWLRTSVFPGQAGVSAIFGRAEAYGAPFGRIATLRKGDRIRVTTQVNTATYQVTAVRRAHSPGPAPLSSGQGRLTLVTADESLYVPSGLIFVDAVASDLPQGPGTAGAAAPGPERPLGAYTGRLWEMVFGLQALAVAVLAGAWSWLRWGRAQTLIVAAPVIALLAYFLGTRVTDLLPNLM